MFGPVISHPLSPQSLVSLCDPLYQDSLTSLFLGPLHFADNRQDNNYLDNLCNIFQMFFFSFNKISAGTDIAILVLTTLDT